MSSDEGLPFQIASDGESFVRGCAYVITDDAHLVIDRGCIRVQAAPREKFVRPSIDVLFRSAAIAYGRRVVGVILTGMLDDGTAGLWQIKEHGGATIVQDPAEAEHPGMPQNALKNVAVDHVLPLQAIAAKLCQLAAGEGGSDRRATKLLIVIWAAAAPATFFRAPDAAVLPSLGLVSGWATSQNYEPAAISTFLQVSDYYLIAQARAYGFTVVTHEIPSACAAHQDSGCVPGGRSERRDPIRNATSRAARFVLGA